jgi:hypothetical protein
MALAVADGRTGRDSLPSPVRRQAPRLGLASPIEELPVCTRSLNGATSIDSLAALDAAATSSQIRTS